jgi:Flp pilus assembly protein TadB
MTLSDLASDLKSDFVSLVGEVHSGNSRVNSLSDLITDIDGTLKSTEESLSVFVLIEFEVAVLLVEVDVLVLTPPYIIVFLILISSLLLCSLYAFLLITQFAD